MNDSKELSDADLDAVSGGKAALPAVAAGVGLVSTARLARAVRATTRPATAPTGGCSGGTCSA